MEQENLIKEFEKFASSKDKLSFQEENRRRNMAIKEAFDVLTKEGKTKSQIVDFLMDKFDIHSPNTIYVLKKKAEEELKNKES